MKRLRRSRFSKHKHTYGFVPGNTVVLPAEVAKEKIAPDPKMINIPILADFINAFSDNHAISYENGLLINNEKVIIRNGVCEYGGNKFRFSDCFVLLDELSKERAVRLTKDQIRQIEKEHYNVIYRMLNNE